MNEKIIAVDFDGTLCEDKYPAIGAANNAIISIITKLKAAGNILILYTCRRDEHLTAAVEWCAARGLTFDYINENAPQIIEKYGADTRKISADVYIDDKACNLLNTFSTIGEIMKAFRNTVSPIVEMLISLTDKPASDATEKQGG